MCYLSKCLRVVTQEFELNVLNANADLLCITVTWLNSSVSDGELFDDGYIVYIPCRRDRETSASTKRDGGSVLNAVKRNLKSVCRIKWSSDAEDLWVTIYGPRKIHLCCVYLPPSDEFTASCFVNNLSYLFSKFADDIVTICGDFNLPNIQWIPTNRLHLLPTNVNPRSSNILDEIHSCELLQMDTIKNYNNTLLDPIFCNDTIVTDVTACDYPLVSEDPHHRTTEFTLAFVSNHNIITKTTPLISNFRKADFAVISEYFHFIDWSTILDRLELSEMVSVFYEKINYATSNNVPKRKMNGCYLLYFTTKTIKLIKLKNKAHKKWKLSNSFDYVLFCSLRKQSKQLISNDYKNYTEAIEIEVLNMIQIFWQYVNGTKKK